MNNLTDLQKKYEELGAEIEALKEQNEWPQEGDVYHYINSVNEVDWSVYDAVNWSKIVKAAHNIFHTKEEAQAKADWRQMTDDLWAYTKKVNGGWEPDWTNENENKEAVVFYQSKVAIIWTRTNYNTPTFKSEALAQQAIDHFGDRLNILRDYRG